MSDASTYRQEQGGVLRRVTVLADALGAAPASPMARLVQVCADLRSAPWRSSLPPTWLALSVLTGSLPTGEEVCEALRDVRSASGPDEAAVRLLTAALEVTASAGMPPQRVEVVTGEVLVDVHHTASSTLLTGVQRVVRQVARRWGADHPCRFVQWREPDRAALVDLAPGARAQLGLLAPDAPETTLGPDCDLEPEERVLVPWRSTLVLLESAASGAVERLGALGEHSGNRLCLVGYDTIPVSSADTVTLEESERFASFLTVLKHADTVAGISGSAASEFAGFVHTLSAQGLPGPRVVAVPLPVPAPDDTVAPPDRSVHPVVLVVGSHEPRKNHLAVLHAAERLWREGRLFRLRFVGGSGWLSDDFDAMVEALQRRGRDLVVERAVSDTELERAYEQAAFTVFPSLHEGFGLPVAESLAHGRLVVTSRHGATAEAADGRAVLVDPRDDDGILAAVRSLLDPDLQPDLDPDPDPEPEPVAGTDLDRSGGAVPMPGTHPAPAPVRTWDQYARLLWDEVVDAERAAVETVGATA